MRISDWSSDVCSSDLDAPGTASRAADTSPPAEDSDTARVSPRAFSRPPTVSPSLVSDRIRRLPREHARGFAPAGHHGDTSRPCAIWGPRSRSRIMSKAFTKETDGEIEDDEADAPSPLPRGTKNYITPRGFRALQDELKQLRRVERPKVVEIV